MAMNFTWQSQDQNTPSPDGREKHKLVRLLLCGMRLTIFTSRFFIMKTTLDDRDFFVVKCINKPVFLSYTT